MIVFEERRLENLNKKEKDEDNRIIKFKEVRNFIEDLNKEIKFSEKKDFVDKLKQVISVFLSRNLVEKKHSEKIDDGELLKLKKEKEKLEDNLSQLTKKETEVILQKNKLEKEKENEKDSERKAEIKIFEIKTKQSEIFSELNKIKEI